MWWGHRQFFVATRRSFLNSFTTAPETQIYTGIHSFTFSGFSERNILLDITHTDGSKICLDRRRIQDRVNVKKEKKKEIYHMYNLIKSITPALTDARYQNRSDLMETIMSELI